MSEPPSFDNKVTETWISPDPSLAESITIDTLGLRLVKIEAGESLTDYEDITNCDSFKWRNVHAVTPRFLPNSKIPLDFIQSHNWIEGEFSLKTTDALFDTYAPNNAEAVIIPYFAIFTENMDNETGGHIFYGLIISSIENELGTDKEPTITYKFLAYDETGARHWHRQVNEHWTYYPPPTMYQLVVESWISDSVPSFSQFIEEQWGS